MTFLIFLSALIGQILALMSCISNDRNVLSLFSKHAKRIPAVRLNDDSLNIPITPDGNIFTSWNMDKGITESDRIYRTFGSFLHAICPERKSLREIQE